MDADTMFAPLRPRKTKKRSRRPAETAPDPEIVSNPPDNAAAIERAEAILWVRGQIAESAPLAGTPGERYLVEHRGLKGPVWPPSLRWAERYRPWPEAVPRNCLLATVTSRAGEIVAVHSIEIDSATGGKSPAADPPKMSRGPVSEGSVFLGIEGETSPTLVIGEGVATLILAWGRSGSLNQGDIIDASRSWPTRIVAVRRGAWRGSTQCSTFRLM
jgi:hypothetical protein